MEVGDDELSGGGPEAEQAAEEAAASEAAEIGGAGPSYEGDEADRAVAEGGGGEAEGFEQAEQALIEQAENLDAHRSPRRDAFTPEQEADSSTGEYSEADDAQPPERDG